MRDSGTMACATSGGRPPRGSWGGRRGNLRGGPGSPRPRGLAVGFEVVLAAVQVIGDARRVRHRGGDERGLRPARRVVLPPLVCHGNQYAPIEVARALA